MSSISALRTPVSPEFLLCEIEMKIETISIRNVTFVITKKECMKHTEERHNSFTR